MDSNLENASRASVPCISPQDTISRKIPMATFPTQYDESGLTEFERLDQELRGKEIELSLKFADGKSEILKVASGQDVAFAKSQICKRLDVSYGDIQLYLNGKLMIDPLSFGDFPEIAAQTENRPVEVNVKVCGK